MASLEERVTGTGERRVVVRWREGGRGSRQRWKTFPATKQGRADARFFKASIERAQSLGQMASELIGSEQTVRDFALEWWSKYATTRLAKGTRDSYEYVLDRWVIPYLGELRLRDLSRESIDEWLGAMTADGAGAPTVNRALGILQGILTRAVEWKRLPANPAHGIKRIRHQRSAGIDARTPEDVERIRAVMTAEDAAVVSVLGYEALGPAEAFALRWHDVLDQAGKARPSFWARGTKTTARRRHPELFAPVARELLELHLAQGRPPLGELVFRNRNGRPFSRQSWRAKHWVPALRKVWPCTSCAATGKVDGEACEACAGTGSSGYFRPYDLRHTCATLLIYEGRTPNEVSDHLGHADPGFTLRVYTHVFRDAGKHRRVPITEAITAARRAQRKEHHA